MAKPLTPIAPTNGVAAMLVAVHAIAYGWS